MVMPIATWMPGSGPCGARPPGVPSSLIIHKRKKQKQTTNQVVRRPSLPAVVGGRGWHGHLPGLPSREKTAGTSCSPGLGMGPAGQWQREPRAGPGGVHTSKVPNSSLGWVPPARMNLRHFGMKSVASSDWYKETIGWHRHKKEQRCRDGRLSPNPLLPATCEGALDKWSPGSSGDPEPRGQEGRRPLGGKAEKPGVLQGLAPQDPGPRPTPHAHGGTCCLQTHKNRQEKQPWKVEKRCEEEEHGKKKKTLPFRKLLNGEKKCKTHKTRLFQDLFFL